MATLHLGDCRDVLATMPDNSIDAIVTDPPYELGFMGKSWDASGIAYDVTMWRQCLRVLKPGGHVLAFGGSRTYHRMAVAIEDAGFEIRDQIQWIYGSGFPKSLDVSKAMDKQAGAVREVVGRAAGMGRQNPEWNGTAQGRIENSFKPEYDVTAPATDLAKQWQGWGTALKPAHEPIVMARKPLTGTIADNVGQWGVGALNIDGARIDAGGEIFQRNGLTPRVRGYHGIKSDDMIYSNPQSTLGRWPANVIFDEDAAEALDAQSNGASRFFYVAKVSRAEREAGLGQCDGRANHHPTVKPIDLMRYLVRLVTPKGGIVLDPFTGSGTTGCAAVLEGMDFVGIEQSAEYLAIADARIAHHGAQPKLDL